MKKLFLLLFGFMFAASAANAMNVIDGDPLYRPYAKHFVSQTSVSTSNGAGWNATVFKGYALEEDFTYGFTDKFALGVKTGMSFNTDDPARSEVNAHQAAWDGFGVHANYRAMDICVFKMDVVGSVDRRLVSPKSHDLTTYGTDWGVGLKAGVVARKFTIAASAVAHNFNTSVVDSLDNVVANDESVLANRDFWYGTASVEGKYNFSKHINGVAGAEYDFNMTNHQDYFKTFAGSDRNPMLMKAGVNVNFDSNKYMGVYGTYNVTENAPQKAWGVKATFGIDF